jgi:hypothetical protein
VRAVAEQPGPADHRARRTPRPAGSTWTGGYSCSARWLAGLNWVLCAAQMRVREPCRPRRRWLPGYRAGIGLVAGGRCSTHQAIGRGGAARAHGGDPQGGGPAQIVGGSGARAGNFSPLLAGEVPGAGRAAIVMAVLSALGSAVPAAGRASQGTSCWPPLVTGVLGAAWLLWCVPRRYRPVGIVRADVSPGGLPGCLVWRCPEDADCRCAAGVLALFCRCCRRPGTLKWGWC